MNNFTVNEKLAQWMKEIRRHIHAFPELSFQEYETSKYICQKLKELGVSYKASVAKTGVVADIGSPESSVPCIALRADMDALPIKEETGLPFASKCSGVMHACGHDGHVAMLLGAASLLNEYQVPGRVRLIFQPAEERGRGAEKMVKEKILDGVDAIISGHIDRHFKVGEIAIQNGIICAYSDEFEIVITGRGGHAAKPHETVDSIVAGSSLVTSLQTLVSREIDPQCPSVVSIGRFSGGSAPNVIADKTVLEGTIRCTDKNIREQLINGVTRMVDALQNLYNIKTNVTFTEGYPPIINDAGISDIARGAAEKVIGNDGITGLPCPSMGGEDFSFYLKEIPGCFVRLGAEKSDLNKAAAHSPYFDFDEKVLSVGASFMAQSAYDFLVGYEKNG